MVGDHRSPVLSKERNYLLWQGGEFGNKLRAWRSVSEWEASGFAGKVALRSVAGGGGGLCRYDLLPEDVTLAVEQWIALGIPLDQVMVNEAAPLEVAILQGEYLNDVCVVDGEACWGWFHYSRVRAQMRDALRASSKESRGLRSDLLLELAMTPASHDDWKLLLDRYPGHVLEVSVYDRCLGDTPGRNALVWEVRRY